MPNFRKMICLNHSLPIPVEFSSSPSQRFQVLSLKKEKTNHLIMLFLSYKNKRIFKISKNEYLQKWLKNHLLEVFPLALIKAITPSSRPPTSYTYMLQPAPGAG